MSAILMILLIFGSYDYLCDVGRNNRRFGEEVKYDDQPFREVLAAIFSQVEASHASQSDALGLEKDGEEIGHQDNKEV